MKAIDIISHKDEQTREIVSWGITYEDGSCRWFDSLEDAENYYEGEKK